MLAPMTVRISPIAMMIAAQLMTWTVMMARLAILVLISCIFAAKHFGGHGVNSNWSALERNPFESD